MAKQDIPFTFIDESVVQYGFRVLMSGYQPGLFESNPIMLLMHNRAMGGIFSGALTNDVLLPIGKWNDIKVDGNKLVGYPEFDDDDEMATKIEGKVKKGYLNGASVALVPLAVSDEADLKLPGQKGPTVTKWEIQECSIVDIPNCRNSLAIRNAAGKHILLNGNNNDSVEVIELLNSLIPTINTIMDKKLLCSQLGLPETATDAEITAKLTALKGSASQVTTLAAENEQLLKAKTDAEKEVTQLRAAQETAKNEKLVDDAIATKKLAAGDRDKYLKLAKADFDTTKELIDSMKPYESIAQGLSAESSGDTAELQELIKLSGRELYMKGKFEVLKNLSMPHFKIKYKEYYGQEFAGA